MTDNTTLQQDILDREAEAAELLDGIQGIEVQLGAPTRWDRETGQNMTEDRYEQWRHRANFAKSRKLHEYRVLKRHIGMLRQQLRDQDTRPQLPPLTERQCVITNAAVAAMAEGAIPLWADQEAALQLTDDEVSWLAHTLSTALEHSITGG